MYRVGIDVGGTFTDFVLVDDRSGVAAYYKTLSTPEDPSIAIVDGLIQMMELNNVAAHDVAFLGHGTTVATNMILERKGVVTGLLTTDGFRDVLEIGRQARPALYDYSITKPPPLARRSHRLDIKERLNSEGHPLVPLDENDVRRAVDTLRHAGVQAVAIAFLHSYRNSAHEERCRDIVNELMPGAYVSISSDVLPEFREFERTSTTVLNAYVGPRMKMYMGMLEDRVKNAGVGCKPLTFHSNGGLLSSSTVQQLPVLTCLSGPAAGVVGAAALGAAVGETEIITFDVGGTSTDVSLISEGKPRFTSSRLVDGHPIKMPMIDIHVVGAGGGSIAVVDDGGALKVGPRSAGASPGPIAYGRGGKLPTLTDANICLGRLNPEYLLEGRVKVDRDRAWAEIKRQIADPLGLPVEEASHGMLQIASASMSRAIRAVSSEHGFDLRGFTLYAFGGAGALHAVDVAVECGIRKVLVPREPGTMCARGILLSDISRDYVQTELVKLSSRSWEQVLEHAAELRFRGDAWLADEGIPEEQRDYEFILDTRYVGQTHDVRVQVPQLETTSLGNFTQLFASEHQKTFGYDIPGRAVEVVNVRIKAVGRVVRKPIDTPPITNRAAEPSASRDVYFGRGEGWLPASIYRRAEIGTGAKIAGPAIIEEMSGTTVIPPGFAVEVDGLANLVIGV